MRPSTATAWHQNLHGPTDSEAQAVAAFRRTSGRWEERRKRRGGRHWWRWAWCEGGEEGGWDVEGGWYDKVKKGVGGKVPLEILELGQDNSFCTRYSNAGKGCGRMIKSFEHRLHCEFTRSCSVHH